MSEANEVRETRSGSSDTIRCSETDGPSGPTNRVRSEPPCCRNCRYWRREHGYMDCGAPDSTAWDADGNCDGWQPITQQADGRPDRRL